MMKSMKFLCCGILFAVGPALGGATAAPSVGEVVKPAPDSFTRSQLIAYADTIVDLEQARATIAQQEAALPVAQRPALVGQAQSGLLAIVQRNGLDSETFNAISHAVEQNPALRRQVRQAMMDKAVGT